jgi:hypothetical protein
MSATAASQQVPAVDQPKHPLHALTTFELRDYRRQLERAIAFFDRQARCRQPVSGSKPDSMRCWPSRTSGRGWPVHDRAHDVSGMTSAELERARRDLEVRLALAFPGSPVREPVLAHLAAIDAELDQRRRMPGPGADGYLPVLVRVRHRRS